MPMTGNKRPRRSTAEPRPLWQRVLAGERLPKRLSRHPKCEGTVEDHRNIALDVRELIRKRVFEEPVGSLFHLNLAYPWLRVMRLNSSSLDLQLVSGRIVVVPLVSASCGVMGKRMRLECPLCGRRVRTHPEKLIYALIRLHARRSPALDMVLAYINGGDWTTENTNSTQKPCHLPTQLSSKRGQARVRPAARFRFWPSRLVAGPRWQTPDIHWRPS
jgi:hypothetical protein